MKRHTLKNSKANNSRKYSGGGEENLLSSWTNGYCVVVRLRGKVKTVSGCRKKWLTISQDTLKQNCMAWSKAHAGRNDQFWHGTHQYSKHRVKTAFKDQWGNHFKAERDLGSSVEYLHSIDFGALNSISECRRASSSSKTLSSPTLCFQSWQNH